MQAAERGDLARASAQTPTIAARSAPASTSSAGIPRRNTRADAAGEPHRAALAPQRPALLEADDGRLVHLVELAEPVVPRLAEVFDVIVAVLHIVLAGVIVGVDLERHQAERVERRRRR